MSEIDSSSVVGAEVAGAPAPRLTPATAFRRAAEAACRDGRVDEWESRLLNRLFKQLGLSREEASLAVVAARRAVGEVPEESRGRSPLEGYPLYRDLLGLAFSDRELDAGEQQVLHALRELLEISEDDHMAAVTELGLLGTTGDGVAGAPETPAQVAAREDEAQRAADLEAEAMAEGELKSTFSQVANGLGLYLFGALVLVASLHGAGLQPVTTRGRWGLLVLVYLGCWLLASMGLRGDERVGRVELSTPAGNLQVLPFDLGFLPAGLVMVPVVWGLWLWVERAVRSLAAG